MQNRTLSYIGVFFVLVLIMYTPSYPDPSMAVKWLTISATGIALTALLYKHINGISWAWIGLLIWLIYQLPLALQAVNPVESLAMFWKYAGVAATGTLLAAWWRDDRPNTSALARWLNIGFLIVLLSALGPILKYSIDGSLSENLYQIQGLGGHKNMLTMLLFTAAGFMLYSARHDKHKALRKVFLVAGILALFCTILLRTRSIWIALIISGGAVVLMLFTYAKKTKTPLPKWVLASAVSIPIILGSLYALNVNDAGDATNLSHRVAFWKKSISMWNEHPNGVGPGMWKIHLPAQGLQGVNHAVEQGKTQLLRPHNDYLWVLTEAGWLGAIGYWAFILLTSFYAYKYKPKNREAFHFHLAALFAWMGYIIFSFFDFPLERPEHLLMILFLAGYFHRQAPGVHVNKKQRPILAGVLIATMGLSTYAANHRMQGERELTSVIAAHEKQNPRLLLQTVNAALTPYFNMDRVANTLYYYRGLAYFAQKQLPEAYEAFSLAVEFTPYNLPTLQQLGDFFRLCHDNLSEQQRNALVQQLPGVNDHRDFLQRAEAFYTQTLKYSPHFSASLFNLAELRLRENNHHEALYHLSQVYTPDHASPKFQKLTKRAIRLWATAPPEERRRPQMAAYFQAHDPEFKQIPKTYSQFIQSLNN